jgi:hypothetical protein
MLGSGIIPADLSKPSCKHTQQASTPPNRPDGTNEGTMFSYYCCRMLPLTGTRISGVNLLLVAMRSTP